MNIATAQGLTSYSTNFTVFLAGQKNHPGSFFSGRDWHVGDPFRSQLPTRFGAAGQHLPFGRVSTLAAWQHLCILGIPRVEFGNPYECCERGGAKITLKLILRNMVDQLPRYRQRLKHLNKDMPKWAKMMLSKHDLVVFVSFCLANACYPNADPWPLMAIASWDLQIDQPRMYNDVPLFVYTTHIDIDIISILYPVYDIHISHIWSYMIIDYYRLVMILNDLHMAIFNCIVSENRRTKRGLHSDSSSWGPARFTGCWGLNKDQLPSGYLT